MHSPLSVHYPTLSTLSLPIAHPWASTPVQYEVSFLRAYLLISIPFWNTQGPAFNYIASRRTSSKAGLLPALSSLGTTRTGFLVCGSSLNYLTRHRVLLRNLRRRYSVREIRHRFPLKRISKLLTGYLKIPNHFGYLSHSNTRLSRIPPSQSSMLEFLLIHRIRSTASLSSTLSFPVWHVISWCSHVLQWFIEILR